MSHSSVHIGLVNPKSPDNVGSVMRAAGNYQVTDIYYTGDRYPRALSFQTRSLDLSRKVSKDVVVTGADSLVDVISAGMKVVCVELAVDAVPLPSFKHPEQAFYIFGPEDGSISQDVIDIADEVVYIPTIGCMNLAATVNVVLYDRLAKQDLNLASNELVRSSRDRNNRLQVTKE